MLREAAASLILLTATLAFVPAGAAAADPVIVAVIDTGVDATHPEFNAGQIAYWWDFTPERGPVVHPTLGQTFDPRWGPYDGNGHGTATTSLVGGMNRAAGVSACGKISHAPGVILAHAKVGETDGTISGSISAAIVWAVDTVQADVISMSIGSIVPVTGAIDDSDEATAYARSKGVLVVFSAGNGIGGFGLVPSPTWAHSSGYSPYALSVGGGSRTGANALSTTGNHDPEVVSWSDSTCAAIDGSNGYRGFSGTSFSAPLVAGAAASTIASARAAGQADDPDTIELVLKHAARDSLIPYLREGWGYIGTPEVANARAAAASGTLPAHVCITAAAPCVDPIYEQAVVDTMKTVFTEVLDVETLGAAGAQVFVAQDLSPQGQLATSTPEAGEAEIYLRTLAVGQTATVNADYADEPLVVDVGAGIPLGDDFDLRVYAPGALDDGILTGAERVGIFGNGAGIAESAVWTADVAGDYVVVVYGWSNVDPIDYALTGATFLTQGLLQGEHVANP